MNEDEGQFLRAQVRTVIAALREMDDRIRALEKGRGPAGPPSVKDEFTEAMHEELGIERCGMLILLQALSDYASGVE